MEVDHSRGQKCRYTVTLTGLIVQKVNSPKDQSDIGAVVKRDKLVGIVGIKIKIGHQWVMGDLEGSIRIKQAIKKTRTLFT